MAPHEQMLAERKAIRPLRMLVVQWGGQSRLVRYDQAVRSERPGTEWIELKSRETSDILNFLRYRQPGS